MDRDSLEFPALCWPLLRELEAGRVAYGFQWSPKRLTQSMQEVNFTSFKAGAGGRAQLSAAIPRAAARSLRPQPVLRCPAQSTGNAPRRMDR